MRAVLSIFLIVLVATMTSCSLLEMSQSLWTKVLQGGLTKIGALDPLRIPIVKVDQSEGNTSYRMILRSVEIRGLNSSTLESIHLGRGRLKSNLSEHEAGYVSYTDQHDIDMIRYRFHTVVKEPKVEESQNLKVESIPGLEKSRVDSQKRFSNSEYASANSETYQTSSRYRGNQEEEFSQGQRMHHERMPSRHQNDRSRPHTHGSNYETPNRRQEETRYSGGSAITSEASVRPATSGSYAATRSYQVKSQHPVNAQYPSERVRVVYAERFKNPENNYETITREYTTESSGTSGCPGGCEYRKSLYNRRPSNAEQRDDSKSKLEKDAGTASVMNFESRGTYVNGRASGPRDVDDFRGQIRNTESTNENRYATNYDRKLDQPNNYARNQDDSRQSSTSQRLENRPGYVDIVYADEKDQKMRHFGNLRVEPGRDTKVYSLDDVLKVIAKISIKFFINN